MRAANQARASRLQLLRPVRRVAELGALGGLTVTQKERHTMNLGLVGGIVGSLVGVAGGLIGTYFSIKNTNGPRERAFMIRAVLVCWIALGALFAAMFLLPQARLWIWIPYFILLPFGIRYLNKKQAAIRREEQSNA